MDPGTNVSILGISRCIPPGDPRGTTPAPPRYPWGTLGHPGDIPQAISQGIPPGYSGNPFLTAPIYRFRSMGEKALWPILNIKNLISFKQ